MPLISSGVVKGRRCPICGAEHASCGLPYQGNAVAIPEVSTVAEEHTLHIYTDAEGHTFQMTQADGEASGYTRAGPARAAAVEPEPPSEEPSAQETEPPSEEPSAQETEPPADPTADPEAKAAALAANKARTASENK